MTFLEIIQNISTGGWLAILAATTITVEVVPVKIYPLRWLGKHINAETNAKVDALNKRIDDIDADLKDHVAKGYRGTIFEAQSALMFGGKYPLEQWAEWVDACDKYEEYVKKNNIPNGKAKHAIKFIRHKYDEALDNADFLDIPEGAK